MTINYLGGKLVIGAENAVEAAEIGIVYQKMTCDKQDVEISFGTSSVDISVIARYLPIEEIETADRYEATAPTRSDLDATHV